MIEIPAVVDAHTHWRENEEIVIVQKTMYGCEYAVLMPNLSNPIDSFECLQDYRLHCMGFATKPLFTMMLTENITLAALEADVIGYKIYPHVPNAKATFNSHYGIDYRYIERIFPMLEKIQERDSVLLGHFEMPLQPSFKREQACFKIVDKIRKKFPKLRITWEHVSCKETIKYIKNDPLIRGTISPIHMSLTIDDIIGGDLNPYCFCKPIPKMAEDREILIKAAVSGDKQFMYGTDTAYHPHERKLKGKPGIFVTCGIPIVTQIFNEVNLLHNLPKFLSLNAREWYTLPKASYNIKLIEDQWVVPKEVDGTIPLLADQLMHWRIV